MTDYKKAKPRPTSNFNVANEEVKEEVVILKLPKCKVFNCETLNLRNGPDFKAPILDILKKGMVLEFVDIHKDWVEVRKIDNSKLTGFCHKDFIFIEKVD